MNLKLIKKKGCYQIKFTNQDMIKRKYINQLNTWKLFLLSLKWFMRKNLGQRMVLIFKAFADFDVKFLFIFVVEKKLFRHKPKNFEIKMETKKSYQNNKSLER